MAKKIYLNVDPAGYKLEKAISEHTGEANQIVVTNEDGYIDSSLINVQLPELPEQDPNHYSEGEHQGLTFKVNGGKYTLNNNTVVESNSRSFDLPKNTKSCIYVEISTGQILTARSFPSNCYKLYEVQTYNDSFIVEKDYREKINLTQLIDDDDANSENKTYSASKINEMFNAGGSGHIIQENYTSITNRPNLNFVGNNIAVVDDLDNYATTVQVSSIVETSELPTEDIREDILYNKDGVLYKHYNGEWIIISGINDEGEGDETDDGDTYTYSAKKIKNLIEDAGSSGHDIQKDETSIDPQQSKLNFVGDNISVYNNNNNESTDVKVNSIIAVSNLPVGSDIDENLIYNHNGVLKRYQNGDWITIGEIDDNSEGSINTTYSSDKINSLLDNIDSGGGHTIIHNGEPVPQRDNLAFYPSVVSDNADANTTHVNLQSIIEVEELPTEGIDTNNFYNHNGILKHFDGENWIPIGNGATINDTEASSMSTFSSEKILNLIELSRIRAVSNLEQFLETIEYFALLGVEGSEEDVLVKGGIILIVGEIIIDAPIEVDLGGLFIRGAGSGIIIFKEDGKLIINSKQSADEAVQSLTETDYHNVTFEHLRIKGDVYFDNRSGEGGWQRQVNSKTRFVIGTRIKELTFYSCVFWNILGHLDIKKTNPNDAKDPHFRIRNPLFSIQTLIDTRGFMTSSLSSINFHYIKYFQNATAGFTYSDTVGWSFGWESGEYSQTGDKNIAGSLIFTNIGLQINNGILQHEKLKKIIISNRVLRKDNPTHGVNYNCYDSSATFYEVKGDTGTVILITDNLDINFGYPLYPRFVRYMDRNFLTNLPLADVALDNNDELLIKQERTINGYSVFNMRKIKLSDLKAYFNSQP